MSLSNISPEDTKYKLFEFNEGSISLTEEQREMNCNNVYCLLLSNLLNNSNILNRLESGVLESRPMYVEDGTAGSWEGSGYGARLTINVPDECRDIHLRTYSIDGYESIMVPLSWISMSSSGYNHCSCYGPSEACELTSQSDVSLREIEQWLTGADLVKSSLSGAFVPEEDCNIIAENTACAEAFEEFLEPYILIYTEEP